MRKEPAGELGQSGGFTWWDPLANSDGHVRTSAWLALFVLVRLQGCRSGRTGPARCGPSRRSGSDACAVRGERCLVEGREKCWAILPRSSVAPLDVLMHVENNLTANLLHSFSFLFRAFCPASAAHLPDPPFVPSPTRERERERALFSIRRAAPRRASYLTPSPFLCSESRLCTSGTRSHLIEYIIWIFELYREGKRRRDGGGVCTKRKVRGHRSAERTDMPRDKFMNFVGIWGSCRAGLRCADLDPFCVTRRETRFLRCPPNHLWWRLFILVT